MSIDIQLGRFRLELDGGDVFIVFPGIGAASWTREFGWHGSRWSTIRAIERRTGMPAV